MVWFADFSLLFLVEALGANAPLAEFVHPAVMEIREYDREHEGDYLLTLRTYLANGKDLLATFKALHIHRNTLSYRLHRLAELFNIDWNNGRLLTQLYLSLEMLRFIEP